MGLNESGDVSPKFVLLCGIVLTLIISLPAFLFDYFPFADAVNHLARYRILSSGSGDPWLSRYFVANWRIQPNLGLDLIAVPFYPLLGPAGFLKAAVFLIAAMMVFGTSLLGRALHGRWRLLDLAAGMFVYSWAFAWGFLNYLLGVGLALVFLALWILTKDRHPALRLAIGTVASAALFICHLFAFGLYGVGVFLFEVAAAMGRWRAGRGRVLTGGLLSMVQFWPVVPLGLMWLTGSDRTGAKHLAADLFDLGSIPERITGIVSPMLTYREWPDFVASAMLAGIVLWLLIGRRVTLRRDMWPMILGFSVLVLVMPTHLMGGWGLHFRTSILLAFVVVASATVTLRNRKEAAFLGLAVVAVVLVRVVGMSVHSAPVARDLKEIARAFELVPPGAKMLSAVPDDYFTVTMNGRKVPFFQYQHAACLAIIERSAFVPNLFTHPAQQPVSTRPAVRRLDAFLGGNITLSRLARAAAAHPPEMRPGGGRSGNFADGWTQTFDYLLVLQFGRPFDASKFPLTRVASGRIFTLYRIKHARR